MTIPIAVKAGQRAMSRGSDDEARGGYTGELIVSKYLPDYAQATLDGQTYMGANQAAQAVSVALATAYTGLALYNPVGSGVILLVKNIKVAHAAAPVAVAPIGLLSVLQTVAPTGTTAVPIQNSQAGNAATGKGLLFSAATILTPTWRRWLLDGFTAGALPAPSPPIDLKGDIAILPGGFMGIGALTAISMLGTISWDEVPLAS